LGAAERLGEASRPVTCRALDDFVRMALGLDRRHVVVGDGRPALGQNRPFRMGAPVAGLAEDTRVALAPTGMGRPVAEPRRGGVITV
jgi:hypothetical protein